MPEQIYEFGPFLLQPSRRRLLEDGMPVALGSRALDLLLILVETHDKTVSKAELMRRVWADSAVEENNLTVNMSALRKALRDQAPGRNFIQTISRRGYRFVGAVERRETAEPPALLAPSPAPPETPGIAVLPFTSMSSDPAHEHFGDGIAEDIIAELSCNRWLTVIARNSSFTFKGVPVAIPEIARQFGVRYVLEGSVRISGARVRVTAQLIDAATSAHLIAERYDRELDDIFTAQDDITDMIIAAVRPALIEAEQERSMRRHPDSVDAWAAYQRGVWHMSRFEIPESVEARAWFQRAIDRDPRFAPGYYGLGWAHLYDGSAWMPNAAPNWQALGERLVLQAVALDERDSIAHGLLGLARMVRGDHDGALAATGRALELNPNDATAHGTRGATLVFHGRPLEGLEALARSIRLSPRDTRLRIRYSHVGLGHYFAEQPDAAERVARLIIDRWPNFSFGPRLLAAVLSESGRMAEAGAALAQAITLFAAPFDNFSHARMPWYPKDGHRRMVAALRKAGWTGIAD